LRTDGRGDKTFAVRISLVFFLSALASLPACYQQPVIPPDKPLSCSNPDAAGECPKGFNCIGGRVCAPTNCENNDECPAGLVCTGRGCVLPGTDSGVSAPGLMTEAGAPRDNDASDVRATPDAGVIPDVAPDAPVAADVAIVADAGGGGN
jgi:hypothetical protein